jgi:hypothetical protein
MNTEFWRKNIMGCGENITHEKYITKYLAEK